MYPRNTSFIQKSHFSSTSSYRLDAESRKLCALKSRGGPELSAFERNEDATKGPPRRSNACSFHDEASNQFRAMVTRSFKRNAHWRNGDRLRYLRRDYPRLA